MFTNVTEKDFDNIKRLYFLKKLTVDCYDTNNVSFLENKNFLAYFSIVSKADDWSSLKNCPKLKVFYADGKCTFHNLKDFSDIENETILNLEKFSNLRDLDIEDSSLVEIHVNSHLEYLNVSHNPYLQTVYLPSEYGIPENIYTDNSPYVNIIYK